MVAALGSHRQDSISDSDGRGRARSEEERGGYSVNSRNGKRGERQRKEERISRVGRPGSQLTWDGRRRAGRAAGGVGNSDRERRNVNAREGDRECPGRSNMHVRHTAPGYLVMDQTRSHAAEWSGLFLSTFCSQYKQVCARCSGISSAAVR